MNVCTCMSFLVIGIVQVFSAIPLSISISTIIKIKYYVCKSNFHKIAMFFFIFLISITIALVHFAGRFNFMKHTALGESFYVSLTTSQVANVCIYYLSNHNATNLYFACREVLLAGVATDYYFVIFLCTKGQSAPHTLNIAISCHDQEDLLHVFTHNIQALHLCTLRWRTVPVPRTSLCIHTLRLW